jgi:GAF domain-containing protein
MARESEMDRNPNIDDLESGLQEISSDRLTPNDDELFELSILCNISRALASTMDLDTLLAIVIDEVQKALITEGAGVLLYDENRGDLYWRQIRDSRHILAPQAQDLRLPLHGSIAGWAFRHNKPARVNDTSKDPRYYPEMTRKSGFQIDKVLQVPLNTKDKTIGVLMIMNKIGGDFTEEDEALAISMAGSIALAIENATVYQKLKKSKDDLDMLYRSSMAIATTMDLDHLLQVVVEDLRVAMEVEAAGVLLYDEVEDDLYWKEIQDEEGKLDKHSSSIRLPLDASISGQVYQTGEPALLNNPVEEPNFFRPFEEITGFVIRNEILVPLNTREQTIGVLAVINKKGGAFSDDDVHLCSSLAGVVALAVENASFFQELLESYRNLEDLNRVKTKILNHLSHELRTPLAIIRGSVSTLEKRVQDRGLDDFVKPLNRIKRHVLSLNRLESQVESIMMTGYSWEKRSITGFLQSALDLMEVQTEYTPEIEKAATTIRQWLETTYPTRRDEPDLINIKSFASGLFEHIKAKAAEQHRKLDIKFDIQNDSRLLIPNHALRAIMIGLIKNAIEATPDGGEVLVTGRKRGGRYILSVKDTGIGIPDKDKDLIFEGFYPIQDTESYSSGTPYSFNAGGKGIDLLRIRMFSELYGFKVAFKSKRCHHLQSGQADLPGDVDICGKCETLEDCRNAGGSEFIVDFKLADSKPEKPAPEKTLPWEMTGK